MPDDFIKAAEVGELASGERKLVDIGGGQQVLLFNLGGSYYAVDEECTHAFGRLSMGEVRGEEVGCPVHAAVFSIKTGEVLSQPASEPLTVYSVRVEDGSVLIGPPVK